MWRFVRSVWVIGDVRKKVLISIGILLLFRVLANITIPLTPEQHQRLIALFSSGKDVGQLLGMLSAFSGGSSQLFSIVSLGVYPYITASIVMQLLIPIIPALQSWSEEGEAGRRRLSQITRLCTVPIALLEAYGHSALFVQNSVLSASEISLIGPNWLGALTILFTLTAGSMILIWLGELLTEYGIGNGISLLIFAGILSSIPDALKTGYLALTTGSSGSIISVAVAVLLGLSTVVVTVYLYLGQRRVLVQYPAKRTLKREMLINTGRTTYIPMQINSAGMVPLILANSVVLFPSLLANYLATNSVSWLASVAQWSNTYVTNQRVWPYWIASFLLVVGFTYMYAHMQWVQQDVSKQLQKQGAYVHGIRPGLPTKKYLTALLNRLTLGGGITLGIIALLPLCAQLAGNSLLDTTKIIIVVGVALDTWRQLDAQFSMRNYDGILS